MLTSCWCWWRTTCWSCYCCWFYEGETAVQAVVWGVSEPSQSEPGPLPPCLAVCLRTPSSAGLVVDPAEAQAILSSLFKFGIFVFVFVFISLVLVFTFSPPLPPAGYWPCYFSSSPPCKVLVFALRICGYDHQAICSVLTSNWIHILYGRISLD